MRILITHFDTFGGNTLNASREAARLLPPQIGGATVAVAELPTSFARAPILLESLLSEHQPDVVLSLGQAAGRAALSIERIALNIANSGADNDGYAPQDAVLVGDGAAAYFTTLPYNAMQDAVRAKGVAAELSYSAGLYVCNCIMYTALYLCATRWPHTRAGFVHVPQLPEQCKSDGDACMAVDVIRDGIVAAVEAIVQA